MEQVGHMACMRNTKSVYCGWKTPREYLGVFWE